MIAVKELDHADMSGSINSHYDELSASIIYMYYAFDESISVPDTSLGHTSTCTFTVCSNLTARVYPLIIQKPSVTLHLT